MKHKIAYVPVKQVREWNELARLKDERDELRSALVCIVGACDKYDGVLPSAFLDEARAALKRTEGWRDYDKANLCAKCGHYKSICQCKSGKD